MAEGGFDPFEGKTVDPDETTDEIKDETFTSPPSTPSGKIHTDVIDFTPVKHRVVEELRNNLIKDKVEELYEYLGVQGDIKFVDLDNFRIEQNTKLRTTDLFYYKDGAWEQLTNKRNGRFLSESKLKERFGGEIAMKNNLQIIEKIPPERATKLNKIYHE